MKALIKILKAIFLVTVAITCATFYALFTLGIEWIPFFAMAAFMAYSIKKEYEGMEEDIQTAINIAVKEIWDMCKDSEDGDYSVEYLHNGNWYFINFHYYVTYTEVIGATFMGEYEMLAEKDIEQIVIKELEVRNDMTDEVVDCGFTIADLEDAL
jgi:hypothetical protein